jgi:hypothetical protein
MMALSEAWRIPIEELAPSAGGGLPLRFISKQKQARFFAEGRFSEERSHKRSRLLKSHGRTSRWFETSPRQAQNTTKTGLSAPETRSEKARKEFCNRLLPF